MWSIVRVVARWFVVSAGVATAAIAQPVDRDRLVAHGSTGQPNQAAVGIYVAGTGMFRSALFPASTTLLVQNVSMDADNVNLLVRMNGLGRGIGALARVSPLGLMSTLTTLAQTVGDGGIAIDEDGSYLTTGPGSSLLRVAPTGVTTLAMPHRPDHVLVEPLTGDYWIAGFGGQLAIVDRDTLSVTSVSVGRFASFFGMAFDTRTDAVVLASQINPGLFFVDQGGQLLATVSFPGTTFGVSIDPVDGHWHTIQNFSLLEATSNGTVVRTTPLTGVSNPSAIEVYGSRPLSGAGRARPGGTYTLSVGFPGGAGRSYAVLLSLAGLAPGVPIPGGGFVGLRPDPLFFHTAAIGDVPGVTQRLRGVLNGRGNATATVRIPARMPTGIRVFASVVLIDPMLPSGIRSGNSWGFTIRP